MNYFYINLDRRTDRKEQIEAEFSKMGIQAERFPAISHSMPAIGCGLSHLEVLKMARNRGYDSVCIFEDDFEFLVSKEKMQSILNSIPEDFDVVMLSYYLIETESYDALFGRVKAATTASGYIVNRRMYDRLIENLEYAMKMLIKEMSTMLLPIYSCDQYWKVLQPSSKWLYSIERVGHQRPSYSDLVGGHVSYNY